LNGYPIDRGSGAQRGVCLVRYPVTHNQYADEQFQRLMADSGIVCSMSRSGNAWNNAAMECFFSSLKTERTERKSLTGCPSNRQQLTSREVSSLSPVRDFWRGGQSGWGRSGLSY
jgi:transposase InsO family protein